MRFLRANMCEAVSVSQLSTVAGVSQRTLRYAFKEFCGLSPKRFVLHQRLCAVREALLTADSSQTTVTDVATLYGFLELGRFAGQYKAVFGETPSRTLRASGSPWNDAAEARSLTSRLVPLAALGSHAGLKDRSQSLGSRH